MEHDQCTEPTKLGTSERLNLIRRVAFNKLSNELISG